MRQETGLLIARMNELLEGLTRPDVEDTLMDGYARALALETERARLERRFAELTADLAGEEGPERLSELRTLRQSLSSTDEELSRLRAVLAHVRRRFAAARSGLAAETQAS